jgi:hypothetical protein
MSMRRAAAWAFVVAATAGVAACGFVCWPFVAGAGRRRHQRRFGRLVAPPETVAFVALPWPRLHVSDARLEDAFGVNPFSAPDARLDMSIGTLLRGRLVPTRAFFVTPTATLDFDRPQHRLLRGPRQRQPGEGPERGRVFQRKRQLLIARLAMLLEKPAAQDRFCRQTLPSGLLNPMSAQIVRHQPDEPAMLVQPLRHRLQFAADIVFGKEIE